jgi:hypothetical protein
MSHITEACETIWRLSTPCLMETLSQELHCLTMLETDRFEPSWFVCCFCQDWTGTPTLDQWWICQNGADHPYCNECRDFLMLRLGLTTLPPEGKEGLL